MAATTYPDRGPAVRAATTATLVICSVFVSLRLLGRIWIVRKVTSDDYFIILAWMLAFGLSFAIDWGTKEGLGKHDADIPSSWQPSLRRSEYAFSVLYNPALMATKTSVLIFYLRLSHNTNRLLRIASYVTLAIVNVAGVVLTFISIFQCRPLHAAFDNSVGTCISLVNLYQGSAPVNIITDLTVLVLPLPVLTGMQLPKKQKIILIATFALGVFVTVVDVVRIYYLQQASIDRSGLSLPSQAGRLGDQADFAYYASFALMWSAVEVNIGIICACVPTLKPLVSRLIPKLIQDRSKNSSKTDTDKSAGSFSGTANITPEAPQHPLPEAAVPKQMHPLPPHVEGANEEEEIGFMNFLTLPGMDPSALQKTETALTYETYQPKKGVYFGFVNLDTPRSMLTTTHRESFKYCTVVTILFFLWGFSYGLLNTLNGQISALAHSNSQAQALGLQTAYFGAYLLGPLTVGRYVLIHGGFKATFITGLCTYGVGTLMFWPSAVLTSFPGFVVSNIVVAFGLSVLETAANPFLVLCGPPDYGEMRLLLAQAVQAVGSVLSPLLAQKVLFKDVSTSFSLIDVQWTYLAIALFDVILALFFYYMPLPEATDDDLELSAKGPPQLPRHNLMTISRQPTNHSSTTIFGHAYKIATITLILGVISQTLYVASQESISINIPPLITSLSQTPFSSFDTLLIGHATFAIGRFMAAGFCLFMLPRYILLGSYVATVLFSILITTLNGAKVLTAMAILLYLFEGPLFPLILAIAIRKLGRRTKSGAACLVAGASGGAWFPWLVYAAQSDGESVKMSFIVIVCFLSVGTLFSVYLCSVRGAREQVDPWQNKMDGLRRTGGGRKLSLVQYSRKNSQAPTVDARNESVVSSSGYPTAEHREMGSPQGMDFAEAGPANVPELGAFQGEGIEDKNWYQRP